MYQEKFSVDLDNKEDNTAGINWFKPRLANLKFNLPYYSNSGQNQEAELTSNTGSTQFDRDSVLIAKEAINQGGDPFWGAWDSGPAASHSVHEKAAYFSHYIRQTYGLDHDDCACSVTKESGWADEPDSNYPRQDQWTCPRCDQINERDDENCSHCGTERPIHERPQEHDSKWVTSDATVQEDRTVKCPECGGKCVMNSAEADGGTWRCTHGDWTGEVKGDESPDEKTSAKKTWHEEWIDDQDKQKPWEKDEDEDDKKESRWVESDGSPAASVRAQKEKTPEKFCSNPKCLYRTDEQYCPRHQPKQSMWVEADWTAPTSQWDAVRPAPRVDPFAGEGSGAAHCPKCGSPQKISAGNFMGMPRFQCQHCGTKFSSMQKGSPYPKNDDAVDHSAPGHKLPAKVNEIYNAVKREHPEYSKAKAMAIAWSRSGLKKEESLNHESGELGMTPNPLDAQPKYQLSPNAWGGYSDAQGREFSKSEAKWLVEMGRAEIGDPRPTMADEVGQQNLQGIFGEGGRDEYRHMGKWNVIALGEMQQPGGVGMTVNPDAIEPYHDVSQGSPEQRNAVETWVNIAVTKLNDNPDFNQHPELLSDLLKAEGCPEQVADEVVAKAMNQPQQQDDPQQQMADSEVPDQNAAMAEQPQPQVARGAKVKIGKEEGEFVGSYTNLYNQELAKVRTADRVRDVSLADVEVVPEPEAQRPLDTIKEFAASVDDATNDKSSVLARITNMKTIRKMCRNAIHVSDFEDQAELDKIDSDAQVEIINLTDELKWMGDAVRNKDFVYDGFGIEGSADPIDVSYLDRIMDEHPALVVASLGEAAVDPEAIEYAAKQYISSYTTELSPEQREAVTKRFVKSAIYFTQEARPEPTPHVAHVDGEGPAEGLFI